MSNSLSESQIKMIFHGRVSEYETSNVIYSILDRIRKFVNRNDPCNANKLINKIHQTVFNEYENQIFDTQNPVHVMQMECLKFADYVRFLIQRLSFVGQNYELTTKKNLMNLQENEVSIIALRSFGPDYHYLVVTSYNTTKFMIYSFYSDDFIIPFKVNKILFLNNFNRLQSGEVNTNYETRVSNTEIYKVWKFLTRTDLQNILNKRVEDKLNEEDETKKQYKLDTESESYIESESDLISDIWDGLVSRYKMASNDHSDIETYAINCNIKSKTNSNSSYSSHNKRSKKGEKKSRRKKSKTRKRSKSKRQSPFRETI